MNSCTPGGYGGRTPAVSYQCSHGRCNNCTKQTCTCPCHALENKSAKILDLKMGTAADSHS